MYRKTAAMVLIRDTLEDILDAVSGTPPGAALFDGCKVKLYTNDLTPSSDSELADFTEATFTGYAEVTLATLTGPVRGSPNGVALIQTANFIAGALAAPGETAIGYFITNGAEDDLLAAERFDTSVSFANAGDFLNLDLIWNFPLVLENNM